MPRRLTDRSLPPGLSSISPDANLFDELMEMEKRLDWTMTRRRQEITDTLNRGTLMTKRTLRIFMSHSVKNQSWQQTGDTEPKTETAQDASEEEKGKSSLETGAGVPSWTFKIEGKLIQPASVPTPKRWPVPKRQFSQLVRSIAIEMDRDPSLYADTNHVQWVADPRWSNYNLLGIYPSVPPAPAGDASAAAPPNGATPLDGFTVTRSGDAPTVLRITVHLNHYPERIKVAPHLAAVLGIHEDTRSNILGAFWHYVKSNGLQDKNDRKLLRLDERLRAVFKYESLNFQDIPTLLSTHMQQPDPIVLHYEIGTHRLDSGDVDMADSNAASGTPTPGGIGVDKDGQSATKAFDVELEMDDLWMRAKAGEVIMSMQPEAVSIGLGVAAPTSNTFVAIQKADDDIKLSLQNLRALRTRREFFTSLASQPAEFIQKFVESQSRDLEVIMGNERAAEGGGSGGTASIGSGVDGGVREGDLMRSQFFEGDWVYEAVGVHEGLRMGGAVAAMHHAQAAHMHQQNMQQGMPGMAPGGMHMQLR